MQHYKSPLARGSTFKAVVVNSRDIDVVRKMPCLTLGRCVTKHCPLQFPPSSCASLLIASISARIAGVTPADER